MAWARSAAPALAYFYGCTFVLLILNLLPLLHGTYHLIHALYTAALVVCLTPFLIHLIYPTENLPFFELICLLHGLQYAVFPFLGLSPNARMEYLTYRDLVEPAALTFFGVLMLVVGYYTRPIMLFLKFVRPPVMRWTPGSAITFAVVFMGIGITALLVIRTGRPIAGAGQLLLFSSNLALVGCLTFFILRLRRQLGFGLAAVVFLAFLPAYLLLAISGGFTGPIPVFGLAFIMVYMAERRRVPWGLIAIGILIWLPFNFAKNEYRSLIFAAGEGRAQFHSLQDVVTNVSTFADMAGRMLMPTNADELLFMGHVTLVRFDIAYPFAHVVKLTPAEVPFLGGESYVDVLWKLIPRIVAPDKPDPGYGQIFGHSYFFLDPNDYTTSINFPQMVEMYVNFGVAGVIIGMFAMSQIYRLLTYFLNAPAQGDWITVFATSIFANQFRIESNFSLVIGGIFYHTILILAIGFFIRALPQRQRAALGR